MSDYVRKMQQLRSEIPQGSTIEKRKKSDQEGFKRMESSSAFPTSDKSTGKAETPGDLGEVAYPQSDRMDAEEALLNKLAGAVEARPPATTTSTTKPTKQSTRVTPTTPKHTRSNYAPSTPSKRVTRGKGPVLDTLKNYRDKQTEEYFSIAKEVIPPKDYQDFTQNYEAQVAFAEDAALKSFQDKVDGGNPYTTQMTKLPDGSRLDTLTFEDGSKYYVYPDVEFEQAGPGDVIRLEPPEDKK